MPVFHGACKIGMTRANTCYSFGLHIDSFGAHLLLPVGPVEVFNLHCNRRAKSFTMAHAREKANGVFLNFHASTTAIAALPAM